MSDDMGLSLSVTIPATEWAETRRRLQYLEATLVQVMREGERIKEWFTAAELSELRLPGLPSTKAAITRAGRDQGWRQRKAPCRGGERFEYHFSSLPRRAFDTLIERVLTAGTAGNGGEPAGGEVERVPFVPAPFPMPAEAAEPSAAEPPWVLPLMRTLRREGPATIREAVELLPRHLPQGMACPSFDQVAEVLTRLGMVR